MEKRPVLSTLVSCGPYHTFVEEIFSLSQYKPSSYVCFANVHMITEAYKDPLFCDLLNKADIVTPDGGPIAVFMRLFHGVKQDRVAGMDLLPFLMKEAETRGKSIYFYGTTENVLQTLVQKANQDFPLLRIAGTYSPPFRALTQQEDEEIIRQINGTKPDLVFVALGCPKQEQWMANHLNRINGVMLGVGQAFLTYAGLEQRLPKWARNLSIEWMYRLYLEPKRLWKRYLINNSLFLLLVLKTGLKHIFRSGSSQQSLNEGPS
jgi:N-acetylglucosaminyldiphosphoundecaprenol N-acetyl-beta-D-mannosaminyltransferase